MQKTIVITGGSDGLGKAIAKKLVEGGNKVFILSNNIEELKKASKQVNCEYYRCDVTKYENA